MSDIYSFYGNPVADKVARKKLEYIENAQTTYEEKGDLYDLLRTAENTGMAKTGYRINATAEQVYANNTIHYFDPALIEYERILIRCHTARWSEICYYNPNTEIYTSIMTLSGNSGRLLQLDAIPDECYLAISSPDTYWGANWYSYLGRVWTNPNYVSKFAGLDTPLSEHSIPLELAPIDYSGYIYLYLDLGKYENCMVRIVKESGAGTATVGFHAADTPSDNSFQANGFSLGNFCPWIYGKRYLIMFFRTNDFVTTDFDVSVGWIDPNLAIAQKKKRYFGTALAAHNCDTKSLLVPACVWADVVDIDICRTLDGYYVLMHGTTINGHTIAETNLADMELTYDQMELDDAISIMQMYGATCYTNTRETTAEQHADVAEKIYARLGKAVIYDTNATGADNPLNGHVKKFYCWKDGQTIDTIVDCGFDISKVYAPRDATSTNYTYHDWIPTGSINPSSASDIPSDGSVAMCFISGNIDKVLNG